MPQDTNQLNKKSKKLEMPRDKSKAVFNATFRNWDFEHIQELIQELNDILTDMVRMESDNGAWIKNACPTYGIARGTCCIILPCASAISAASSVSWRPWALSSLGRSESHVMANVIAVIKVLESLAGHDQTPADKLEPPADMISGQELLDLHTRGLLGESPRDRSTFIMVTMPSEAAEDYTVIRDLVESGMDCMRINCAHDDARAWAPHDR